jgi:hypothetical protein
VVGDRAQHVRIRDALDGAQDDVRWGVADRDRAQHRRVLDPIERLPSDRRIGGAADDVAQHAVACDTRERRSPDLGMRRRRRQLRQAPLVDEAGERGRSRRAGRCGDGERDLAQPLGGEHAEGRIGVVLRDGFEKPGVFQSLDRDPSHARVRVGTRDLGEPALVLASELADGGGAHVGIRVTPPRS